MTPSQHLRLRMEKQWSVLSIAKLSKICQWGHYPDEYLRKLPKLTKEEIQRAENPELPYGEIQKQSANPAPKHP